MSVFVLSNQLKTGADGRLVPKFNFSEAKKFGDIRIVLQASCNTLENPDQIVESLHDELCDFTAQDYLLPLGNPALIGWATTVATYYAGGAVTILSWDRHNKQYRPVTVELL